MQALLVLVSMFLMTVAAWAGRLEAPDAGPQAVLRALEDAFANVADRVTPAVVNVIAIPRKDASPAELERFREFFGDEFVDRFRRRRDEPRATGSGVIVDPSGYILTNNHVVENAQAIIVRLSDARKLPARLVGRDVKTDLAVLKVDGAGPLPVAELGDSDRLRVGQWVIAIGNPFGLDRTVTAGIVSATARTRVGVATYENFIQTDASINPGNSGGPLLNLDGKVVGINTAIVASGQGIGFAIPANMARDVMKQLIAGGRVVRGWLGIVIQDVTDELASSFGVRERQGVLIADVMKGGPAEVAGVRAGDVVVQFAGETVREVPELQRRVAAVTPGQSVTLVVVRDEARLPMTVAVAEMPTDEPAAARSDAMWGLTIEPLPADDPATLLGRSFSRGVVITEVAPGSAAERAGLQRGDIILAVKGRTVGDAATFYRELAALKPGNVVPLWVHRAGSGGAGKNEYVVLERPRRP